MRFVPDHLPPNTKFVELFARMISSGRQILVLTGAGLSTESGLPDYRSPIVGLYARSNRRPINYCDFVSDEQIRRRYWARNFLAWPYFSKARPNNGHILLSKWLDEGRIFSIITQNIDALQQAAGARDVLELHGSSYVVICLKCGNKIYRTELQDRFIKLNPGWDQVVGEGNIAPDGDVEVLDKFALSIQVPNCSICNGILKPDVVFFGENLPHERKLNASALVTQADLLVALGTSFQTFSALRLALEAKEMNIPLVIVNIGPTRADEIAQLKIDSGITKTLEETYKLIK